MTRRGRPGTRSSTSLQPAARTYPPRTESSPRTRGLVCSSRDGKRCMRMMRLRSQKDTGTHPCSRSPPEKSSWQGRRSSPPPSTSSPPHTRNTARTPCRTPPQRTQRCTCSSQAATPPVVNRSSQGTRSKFRPSTSPPGSTCCTAPLGDRGTPLRICMPQTRCSQGATPSWSGTCGGAPLLSSTSLRGTPRSLPPRVRRTPRRIHTRRCCCSRAAIQSEARTRSHSPTSRTRPPDTPRTPLLGGLRGARGGRGTRRCTGTARGLRSHG